MSTDRLIIGTRGSDLALWQAHETARLLGGEPQLKIIKTDGDRFLDIALQGRLEQGFFTTEIEQQLLEGQIDIAVHSLKDLPTQSQSGLTVGAYLQRAPVSDLLLIHPAWHDPARALPLRDGCQVGAMSLRRQALLRQYAPWSAPVALRGNVPSRVKRCADGGFGAVILARAGVERLQLELGDLAVYELNPELWLPAPGQGAIAVQARAADTAVLRQLAKLDDAPTRLAVGLERRLLANFEGGCHTAFGAWARPDSADEYWSLRVGLERGAGWEQAAATGKLDALDELGPHSAWSFSSARPAAQEELCRLVRP